MSTEYSVDPFLGEVCLIILFLDDGKTFTVLNHDSRGRHHEGGDIINLNLRNPEGEIAVVLGAADTEEEATEVARTYLRRVAKWHGHEPNKKKNEKEDERIEFCGYDMSQSQLFQEDKDPGPSRKRSRRS
ncbi:uncharacterized protein LOC117642740 [Thrips palmi]|uniref:Uncharacterized protein LOC117642740 n=1 Tax=Thrips palmi TaxID=161013 RepID=A0A6P8YST6_THRPL|nr:uncharacterized protein LOC117642740 [Thrips palmi]XP_034237123.1 uncharacterized protein LOC117642740 [Thrips palmi]